MDIEERIRSLMLADATVASLVDSRIYPGVAPQSDTLPVVIYSQADQRTVMSLTGRVGLNSYRMRVEVYAVSYPSAKSVYHAIREALIGYRDSPDADAPKVRGIFEDGGDDEGMSPIHADEQGLFRAGLDLSIWYS